MSIVYIKQHCDNNKIEEFENCIEDGTHQEVPETIGSEENAQSLNCMDNEEITEQIDSSSKELSQMQQVNQIQQPNNVTLTPIRLPAILDGEFFSVIRLEESNVTARCSQCQKLLNGSLKSTGNFLSHMRRVHPLSMDKVKTKSNQRRPAAIFIDVNQGKIAEVLAGRKIKRLKVEPNQVIDETFETNAGWSDNINNRRSIDENESFDNSRVSQNNTSCGEDEYDSVGRNIAAKLRKMRGDQQIIAEKLINDVIFEAQLGNLQRDSSVNA